MDVARLYQDNYRTLSRYLFRFTGDADRAADAAQEAFVRLMQQPPRPMENPRAWLFKVATNLANESSRTATRRRTLLMKAPGRAPHADPPPTPDEALQSAIRRGAVQEALLTLSEKERMALLMREEGFAQKEIAEAVGTTTGSVGTLISRALARLAGRLQLDKEDV
jgi:RNA polymerase sigma factor (sigma-70 family)